MYIFLLNIIENNRYYLMRHNKNFIEKLNFKKLNYFKKNMILFKKRINNNKQDYFYGIKGLSLLEALLTVTLVTVAVSVVLPVSKIYIVAQREESIKKNLGDVRDAIDRFKKEQSHYPVSIDQLIENRYLRRLEPEPFGNKWQYMPHTGPHEWKDFTVSVLTEQSYLASVKYLSMKTRTYTSVKVLENDDGEKDRDKEKELENGKGGSDDGENGDGEKGSESDKKTCEVELYEEIFDIRTSTDYTGINGVPYNLW